MSGFTPSQGADFDRWLTHTPDDDLVPCPKCSEDNPDPGCDVCGGDGVVDCEVARRYRLDEAGHEKANIEAQEYRGGE